MSDHLDFIRIQGLEVSPDELFQGAGCSVSGVSADTASGSTGASWLDTLITELEESWLGLSHWIGDAQSSAEASQPDDEEESRGIGARMLPAIPAAGALATLGVGGAVTAIGAVGASYTLGAELAESITDFFNPISEQWRLYGIEERLKELKDLLRSALMLKTLNPFDDEESILKRALLYQRAGDDEWRSILDDRLTEIAALEAEFELSDAKFSIKNHVFEYSIQN